MSQKFRALLFITIFSILFETNSYAQNSPLIESYLLDAVGSTQQADYYRAIKILHFVRLKDPKYFYEKGLTSFIESAGQLYSRELFHKLCTLFTKKAPTLYRSSMRYQCGRFSFGQQEYKKSIAYLQGIKKKSKEFYYAQILIASNHLGLENPEACIDILKNTEKENYKMKELYDLFLLTKARCNIKKMDYEKAIENYQIITSDSEYYFTGLEEISWVYFKLRDRQNSEKLLNVIASSFESIDESTDIEELSITPAEYFRSKYLRAYLDIVLVQSSTLNKRFILLEEEVKKFQAKEFPKRKLIKKSFKELEDSYLNYESLSTLTSATGQILFAINDWADSYQSQNLENSLRWHIALQNEITRFDQPKNIKYITSLKKLRSYNFSLLKNYLATYYDFAYRLVGTLGVKSLAANKELEWIRKTKGIRSLDEATSQFKSNERRLAEALGDTQ